MVIWNILRPFGKVVAIWNILRPFGKVVAIWYILVHCVKKYLATLVHGRCFNAGAYYTQASGRKSRTRLQAEDAAACERGWGGRWGWIHVYVSNLTISSRGRCLCSERSCVTLTNWGGCYDHNFLRFLPIFGKKIGVFLKNQCYDQNFA
jgi:hypothetical protein